MDLVDVVHTISRANRVMMIGCSGNGKSRLSRQISEIFNLPDVSMDREVFWLPRLVSLVSVLKRLALSYGRTRPDMPSYCPERIDFEFIHDVWTFEKVMVPKIEKALADTNINIPIVTLKSFAESDRLVAALRPEKNRNAEIRDKQAQPA